MKIENDVFCFHYFLDKILKIENTIMKIETKQALKLLREKGYIELVHLL